MPRGPCSYQNKTRAHQLLDSAQWSLIDWKVAGVQNLDPRHVVSVKRRHRARTSSIGRLGRVSKPNPEVIHLHRSRTGVQDEGLVTENPSYIDDSVAASIGGYVTLVPPRHKGRIRRSDNKEREVRICRETVHFNVHVLDRPEVADRDSSSCIGTETGRGACGFHHREHKAVICTRSRERNDAHRTKGKGQGNTG